MTDPSSTQPDPDRLAEQVAEAMFSNDRVSHRLGIKMAEVRAGYARLSMTVTDDMINGHGICHGSYSFALADTACAYACNSHNENTLSQAVNIVFLAPVALGEILTAEAEESANQGRTSVYQIKIRHGKDLLVAVAQAQCRQVPGRIV